MSLKERLRAAREKLRAAIKRRHEAAPNTPERHNAKEDVLAARQRKDDLLQKLEDRRKPEGPTVEIDGKPVARWIAKWVLKARKQGLWHGYVVSGYRSPEYSTSLCEAMCGAPTCPGRCAGASSNHSGLVYPRGAVDVDLAHRAEFAAAMVKLGAPLRNGLPTSDPNHFSQSGS